MDGDTMEQSNIIDFEQLFTEKNASNHPSFHRLPFLWAIMYYAFMMVFGSTIFFIIFNQMPTFMEEVTLYDRIEFILEDESSILVTTKKSFELYELNTLSNYQVVFIESTEEYVLTSKNLVYPFIQNDRFDLTAFQIVEQDYLLYSLENDALVTPFNIADVLTTETLSQLSNLGLNVLNFAIYIALIPIIIWLLLKPLQYDIKLTQALSSRLLGVILSGYLYVILGSIAANGLSLLLSELLSYELRPALNQSNIEASLQAPGWPLMLLSAMFLGPIVEELIFRKAFFAVFKNPIIALFVSSITFGLIHVIAEPTFLDAVMTSIPYVLLGFVFGYIYLKNNRNVWIPIIVHIISNSISIISLMIL
jgi:uncharacterized protein